MNQLQLGIGREIITPAVGGTLCGYEPDHHSESVADNLTVTAFFFQKGNINALMISATVCEIQTALCNRLLAGLETEFGIPKSNIILCATHTHSGPNLMGEYGWGEIDMEYCESIFIPRLHAAVRTAIGHTQPVRMGVGVGESLVGINRREIKKDGSIALGQNPWGAFDPKMTVLSFADEDDKCVANIIHYGAHCTGAGKNTEITRDWAGVMIDRLEEISGGITAFLNGPEGDVGPRLTNGWTTANLQLALELGGVAAQDAVKIYHTVHSYCDAELSVLCAPVAVPLEKRIPLEEAQKEYEKYKANTVNIGAAMNEHYRQVINSYESNYKEVPYRTFPQSLIRLGEVTFVSFPYELFSEIGLRIAREVKNSRVLSLSNANGADGYFVTEDQICRGGYEVGMFLNGDVQGYRADSDTQLVLETLKNIQKLNEERKERNV
ncbi:MAG: neutral/alkaline non-lysosomal ceramidase N-terminal domain-containing protein [Clostridia bacterium]|nr:neutral/alkaline non-lysosomal ceramidase N-terminal domain-containing protein [Clostridia bacterium]